MKVLILGGYGTFGGRLARLLADLGTAELLIAGRDEGKARRFCEGWAGAARARALRADRADLGRVLAAERPDVVVDASGPFQAYGADPYAAVGAAVAAGACYLDLADGADFVAGIGRFDAEARSKGLWVLAGASTCPALTMAALAELTRGMEVRRVAGGIAPSPWAGVGVNVLRAVLGYAGAPVALRRDGAWVRGVGLGEGLRRTVAPPGALPLRSMRYVLVEVPDLRAIPDALPGAPDAWFGAAPRPAWLLRLLELLARGRSWGLGPSLERLAPLARRLASGLARGEHRGGMFVEAEGAVAGRDATRSWHLVAEGDDGPFIPAMAAAAILRRAAAGVRPAPGARSALGEVRLADYAALFADRRIAWGVREDRGCEPLYERVLAGAFAGLPPRVRALHRDGGRWAGRARVTRGRGPGQLVAWAFGFPRAGRDVAATVAFSTDARGHEVWERRFDGRPMRSTQEEGRGRDAHLVVERFGPVAVSLALVRDGARLRLVPRRWAILGVPLPGGLLPRGETWEAEEAGRFRFHVEIALPLLGPIVAYDGWLEPVGASVGAAVSPACP